MLSTPPLNAASAAAMSVKDLSLDRLHARSSRSLTHVRARHVAACVLGLGGAVALWLVLSPHRQRPPARPPRHATHSVDRRRLAALLRAAADMTDAHAIVGESVAFQRYARVYSQHVRQPSGNVVDFDIVGRLWKDESFAVISVVPYDPATKTFTLIREYNPATRSGAYTFPQGSVEPAKHGSPLHAALAELREEGRLRCDPKNMVNLLDRGSSQDKYQKEVVHYFLCTLVVPEAQEEWQARDKDELMHIESAVSVGELKALIRAGVMQSNVIASAFLAIDHLQAVGELSVDC